MSDPYIMVMCSGPATGKTAVLARIAKSKGIALDSGGRARCAGLRLADAPEPVDVLEYAAGARQHATIGIRTVVATNDAMLAGALVNAGGVIMAPDVVAGIFGVARG